MSKFLNNKGSALLMTVLILASLLTVATGISAIVVPGIVMGRTQIRSTKAYFAAEAGAERVLLAVRGGSLDTSLCIVDNYVTFGTPSVCTVSVSPIPGVANNYLLSNGSSYIVQYSSSTPSTFLSIGSFMGTKRAIEISY